MHLLGEMKVSRRAGSPTPLLAGKYFLYSFCNTNWVKLFVYGYFTTSYQLQIQTPLQTACILHPHAATLWLIGFNSVDGLGNGLMDYMDTLLVHTFHLLYVNWEELRFQICRAKTMISKYQKDTSFTACLTLLGMELFASQRNSTKTAWKLIWVKRGSAQKTVQF